MVLFACGQGFADPYRNVARIHTTDCDMDPDLGLHEPRQVDGSRNTLHRREVSTRGGVAAVLISVTRIGNLVYVMQVKEARDNIKYTHHNYYVFSYMFIKFHFANSKTCFFCGIYAANYVYFTLEE